MPIWIAGYYESGSGDPSHKKIAAYMPWDEGHPTWGIA